MEELTGLAGFDKPDSLRLFLLLIPVALFNILHFIRYHPPGNIRIRYIFSSFFFMLFFCSLVLALAAPHWGFTIRSGYHRSTDIILAFDLSRSMNVRDVNREAGGGGESISRLEAAVSAAGELNAVLGRKRPSAGTNERGAEIRLAVAIGKGRGILAIPLTADTEALSNFLAGLDTSAMGGTGTNLESLLDAALGAFDETFPSNRAVILFSDGETLSGSLSSAAEKALGKDIAVSCIGFGSDAGGPVPLGNADSEAAFLLDGAGSPVTSRLERDVLRGLALKTGGVYFEGNATGSVQALTGYVMSLVPEHRAGGVVLRREPKPQAHIFTIAALFFLGVSVAVRVERRKKTERRTRD
ncbi:MAG: VWA domain-containing protein [Treponema sp.]|jgi:Ca-activated chloride channel family protein|nr:VWA domain-containing protein [Treponema sp.]